MEEGRQRWGEAGRGGEGRREEQRKPGWREKGQVGRDPFSRTPGNKARLSGMKYPYRLGRVVCGELWSLGRGPLTCEVWCILWSLTLPLPQCGVPGEDGPLSML